jgi:phosphonate dehydrogenase
MQKPVVVVTNRIFPETEALLAAHARIIVNRADEPWSPEEVQARCREADAMLAFMTDQVDAAFLAGCPRLKVVGAALKGYDNIDVAAAERAGVWVTIVPDLLTVPTAELAIGLMLSLGRHIAAADRSIRDNGFRGWRPAFYGRGIAESTVGIIGFGQVGQAIAARLAGFGCTLLASDVRGVTAGETLAHQVTPSTLTDILAASDYVVLALPLTSATLHVIDRKAIAAMKPGALLINPARGSLVDEVAVADALETGQLGGYAADAFQCEDWARTDRPADIDGRLVRAGARTVLTPHIGSAVAGVRRDIELSAARNIVAVLSGRTPDKAVNRPLSPRRC